MDDDLIRGRASRLYKSSLKLYPRKYRQEYGEQLLDMLEDMLTAVPSGMGHFKVWTRVWRDLPINVCREYYYALGDLMHTEDDVQFQKMSYLSMGFIFVPLVVIVMTHIAAQLGYIEGDIKIAIELAAILLPLIASILALSALQQITRKFLQKLTKEQHWHSQMLFFIIILSTIVITLSLYDVFVAQQ